MCIRLAWVQRRISANLRTSTDAAKNAVILTAPCRTASNKSSLAPLRSGICSSMNLFTGRERTIAMTSDITVCTRFWVLSSIFVPILLGYDVYDIAYMPEVKGSQTELILFHRAAARTASRKPSGPA